MNPSLALFLIVACVGHARAQGYDGSGYEETEPASGPARKESSAPAPSEPCDYRDLNAPKVVEWVRDPAVINDYFRREKDWEAIKEKAGKDTPLATTTYKDNGIEIEISIVKRYIGAEDVPVVVLYIKNSKGEKRLLDAYLPTAYREYNNGNFEQYKNKVFSSIRFGEIKTTETETKRETSVMVYVKKHNVGRKTADGFLEVEYVFSHHTIDWLNPEPKDILASPTNPDGTPKIAGTFRLLSAPWNKEDFYQAADPTKVSEKKMENADEKREEPNGKSQRKSLKIKNPPKQTLW